MVKLRDVDIAHLVALGGWLRAFEIASVTASDPYAERKAEKLARPDVAAYFIETLRGLEPKLQQQPHIVALAEGLEGILAELGGYDPEAEGTAPKIPDEAQTIALGKKAHALLEIIHPEK